MKKILLTTVAAMAGATGTAFAADMPAPMPVKAVRAPAALPFAWTGCYVGVHAGGGWGDVEDTELDHPADIKGWLAGGQIGCDYQVTSSFLVGLEGLAAWTDIHGQSDPFFSGKTVRRFSTETDWIASATARAGVTADRWLLYVKAGAAWSKSDYRQFGTTTILGFPIPFDARGSEKQAGWTWGIGAEWAFAPNWSTKLEFNQYNFDDNTVRLRDRISGSIAKATFDQTIQTVTFGINYRFATGRP